jgi:type IV pilus assembly protein PilW
MTLGARATRPRARQRGMGIVEVMVGILIGMVVVLAVYNVFALAEGYKRTTVGAADAQTTGLYAQFFLAREIGNAGNVATCRQADASWVAPAGFFAVAGARAVSPVPVLIRDGGGGDQSDRLIVTYTTPSRVVSGVMITDKAMAAGGDPIYVQSPNGFRVNDRILVNGKNGNCELSTVTAVTPGDSAGDVTTGMVGLSHPALANLYTPTGAVDGPSVLNLGQVDESTRTLFDVVNAQLRTTDLFANAPAVPIAQNVVLMKAQYGVDCANNGVVTWTSATNSGVCGLNFRPDDFMPVAPAAPAWNAVMLARIRAVRIAIVVRSDEPDLKDPALVNQTATLFDCSTHDAACQGRIPITNATLADGWRHRIYETIVPMRNAIYNNGT